MEKVDEEEQKMPETPQHTLLNRVLLVNGTVSGATGLVIAIFAEAVADMIGLEASGMVRMVGIGLVLFGVAVVATGRRSGAKQIGDARVILALDVAWVVASIAAVAAGWFNTVGNVLVLAVALVVAAFAVGEGLGLRRLGHTGDNAPALH